MRHEFTDQSAKNHQAVIDTCRHKTKNTQACLNIIMIPSMHVHTSTQPLILHIISSYSTEPCPLLSAAQHTLCEETFSANQRQLQFKIRCKASPYFIRSSVTTMQGY